MRYGVILADPPWSYRNEGERLNGTARGHYNTMSVDELCRLKVSELCLPDCVLLLWATWSQLECAIVVGTAWGFDYVTGFPWIKTKEPPFCDLFGEIIVKPAYGTGFWVRGCSELILIFKRGNPSPPKEFAWLGLISQRIKHSRKPDDVYAYAESLPGPYLELFARRKRKNWDSWGNEIQNDIELSTSTA